MARGAQERRASALGASVGPAAKDARKKAKKEKLPMHMVLGFTNLDHGVTYEGRTVGSDKVLRFSFTLPGAGVSLGPVGAL